MKLLLDTHIWLWGLLEPSRLGPRTLSELRDTANEIWLSPISTWEALLLHAKGKIRLSVDLAEWIAESTAGTRIAARGILVPSGPARPKVTQGFRPCEVRHERESLREALLQR